MNIEQELGWKWGRTNIKIVDLLCMKETINRLFLLQFIVMCHFGSGLFKSGMVVWVADLY